MRNTAVQSVKKPIVIIAVLWNTSPTLPKPHYPLLRTKLASLVKGRWIDGKTQTVALLRFTWDTPAFLIYQTFLPSRRRDCHTNPSKTALSHPLFVMPTFICIDMLSHPHYPLPFNERFASFAKCSKSPTPLPFNERSVCFASCKTLGVQLRASMPTLEKGWGSVAWLDRANYGGGL